MKFSLISDMHVDFPQNPTPYDKFEKNIIVAGDTSNGLLGLKFLNKLRNKEFDVYAVDGNHEHYKNVAQDRTVAQTMSAFHAENPSLYEIEGIPIIGCNGWYPVSAEWTWYRYQNDCRNILGDDAFEGKRVMNMLASMDYTFLKNQLEKTNDKCIVVTHTSPCEETLNPEFEGSYTNEWYWNPLMPPLLEKYSDKILVWCHGHTHAANEAIVHGVRVVCNPRGYPGENPNWAPLTIEV